MKAEHLTAILATVFATTWFIPAASAFTESPALHLQVEAGKLPPLEQRIPVAPVVITPVERPGIYGGTWNSVLVGNDNSSILSRCMGYETLVRWDLNWTRVVPNIASNWTVNADFTVFRFQLRQGMRWSDGHPYTAHDIVAWMDDVARDSNLTPVPPLWLTLEGHLPECTAPDDYTVEFRFASANVLFLEQLAGMRANELTHYPSHYFRKIHQNHDAKGAAELMQFTGLYWSAAFKTVYTPWKHVGVPTINAWIASNAYLPGTTTVVALRNPYYWKVDTLGRQLPYLDEVRFEVVADNATALQRVLNGKVDYHPQDFASVDAAAGPAIAAAERAGVIHTVRVIPSRSNAIGIALNLTHRDPTMRAALSDKRVRIALSEAINRPGLIHELYTVEGKPWQLAPRPGSPFYNRKLGEQYTTYAPEHAKELLEQAGLRARSSDGRRLLPDGRLFQLKLLMSAPPSTPNWPAIMDRIKRDWLAVGVTTEWAMLPLEEFYRLIYDNRHDGAVFKAAGGYTAVLEPENFVPTSFENGDTVLYAIPWARWFIGPKTPLAEKPPESVEKQMNLFRRLTAEPNRETRAALMTQVLEMAADEFYAMGICLDPDRVAIRTPGFRNVPASHFDSWLYPVPGPLNPCQFFHESPAVVSPEASEHNSNPR